MFPSDIGKTNAQFNIHLAAPKRNALRGRRLHPIFRVIVRPAWETIAEPTLP